MFEGLFQPMHLLVIAVIALIVLGPRKLPELGRGLGDGIREFKKSISDVAANSSASTAQPSTEPKSCAKSSSAAGSTEAAGSKTEGEQIA